MAIKNKESDLEPKMKRSKSSEEFEQPTHNYNTRGKRIKITESLLDMLKCSPDDSDDEDYKPGDELYIENSDAESEASEMSEEIEESEANESESEETDENYFEYDFQNIKSSIVKYIQKYTKFNRRKMKRVSKALDKAFELFSDAKKEAMHEIADAEPTKEMWKLGLGPDEIERLKPILEKLRSEIKKDNSISIKDILDANLSEINKKAALQMFDIIQNIEPFTTERMAMTHQLKEYMKNSNSDATADIETELKKENSLHINLKTRILNANIDNKRKAVIYDKYLQLEKLKDESDATSVNVRDWIENALRVPFLVSTKSKLNVLSIEEALITVKKGLDAKLFGMTEVKEQILCLFNSRLQRSENTKSLKMSMIGSPGVGKTQIARSLADILHLPFSQISLGGMVDSTILTGTSQSWVGGCPGRIVKALQSMGSNNGIIFLDEIDKLSQTPHGKEVQASLLHILDSTQNTEFKDNYLGHDLPIDLSGIFFITASNNSESLDPALLSRIPPIKIPDYSLSDKKLILESYVIPKLLDKTCIDKKDVIFPEDSIKYLLSKMETSGGIRDEEDALATIIYRVGLLLTLSYEQQLNIGLSFAKNITKPVVVTNTLIDSLYKKSKEKTYERMYL
jgi:ATP-dependent Lon protease